MVWCGAHCLEQAHQAPEQVIPQHHARCNVVTVLLQPVPAPIAAALKQQTSYTLRHSVLLCILHVLGLHSSAKQNSMNFYTTEWQSWVALPGPKHPSDLALPTAQFAGHPPRPHVSQTKIHILNASLFSQPAP